MDVVVVCSTVLSEILHRCVFVKRIRTQRLGILDTASLISRVLECYNNIVGLGLIGIIISVKEDVKTAVFPCLNTEYSILLAVFQTYSDTVGRQQQTLLTLGNKRSHIDLVTEIDLQHITVKGDALNLCALLYLHIVNPEISRVEHVERKEEFLCQFV